MAKKKFSDLPATTSLGASDLLATSQVDADAQSGYTSKKITGGNVARSINADIEYPTDLETEDKTIAGAINEINSKALAIDSASGNIASFDTAISAPLVSLSTTIVAKGGGGTPATPIPIVGHSALNLVRCGVNLWDGEAHDGKAMGATGGEYNDATAFATLFVPVKAGMEIYLNPTNWAQWINWYDYNETFISQSTAIDNQTTVPSGAYYGRFTGLLAEKATAMVCLASQKTLPYHAYNGQTKTIALGQTIYGGVYDAKTGKVRITHGYKNIADLDFTPSTPANHIFRSDSIASVVEMPPDGDTPTTAISSHFQAMAFSPISASDDGKFAICQPSGFAPGRVVFIDHRYSTIEDFIAGNSTTQLVYPLATPIEIDVSELSVDIIVGVNNVFSDCGVTSLTFIDKMQHYVDKKIAELQALILQ